MSIKNMKIAPSLPSAFARQIAIGAELLPVDYDLTNVTDYEIDRNRLAQFQQLSVAGTFDEALLAYYGIILNSVKMDALRLIYNTTKPWLSGHIVGELLTRMEAVTTGAKESAEIAKMITEAFNGVDSVESGSEEGKSKPGILVRFADATGTMEVSNVKN